MGLEIAHRVHQSRVKEVFAQYRLGGAYARSRSATTLLVAEFVLSYCDPDGELRVDWPIRHQAWNREHPDKAYHRCGDFRQAFRRGLRALQTP